MFSSVCDKRVKSFGVSGTTKIHQYFKSVLNFNVQTLNNKIFIKLKFLNKLYLVLYFKVEKYFSTDKIIVKKINYVAEPKYT